MLLHVRLAEFIEVPWFHLHKSHYRVATIGTQTRFKSTNSHVVVHGSLLHKFTVVFLGILFNPSIKIDYHHINLHLTTVDNSFTLSIQPNHLYMQCQYPTMKYIAF